MTTMIIFLLKNSGRILLVMMLLSIGISFFVKTGYVYLIASFISGSWIGWRTLKFSIIFIRRQEEKLPVLTSADPVLKKISNDLRKIVHTYKLEKTGNSFIYDIESIEGRLMQITHLAHYPELSEDVDKIEFGMALIIPLSNISDTQRTRLENIFIKNNIGSNKNSTVYRLVDLGIRPDIGAFFIKEILENVFEIRDLNQVQLKISDDGKLPY